MHRLRRIFKLYFHRIFLILFLGSLITIFVIGSKIDLVGSRTLSEIYRPADLVGVGDVPQLNLGLFVGKLYDVDHAKGTFSADGGIWGTWDDASDELWRQSRAGRSMSFESMGIYSSNAISKSGGDFIKRPTEKVSLEGGKSWLAADFSSSFKMHQIDYRRFPFEDYYLPVVLTTRYAVRSLVLVPDQRDSIVADSVSLPGYRFVGLKQKNMFHQAKTSWGIVEPGDSDAATWSSPYSTLQWELHFRRAIGPSFVRLFLPLASAMAAVLFSLIVSFKVSTQKISIPASILLVLAVLQDRWHNSLPSGLKYFTYMDELFMFAYLITMVVLVHSVYCVNCCYGASEDIRPEVAVQMRHDQRLLASFISAALLIAPFVLWFV